MTDVLPAGKVALPAEAAALGEFWSQRVVGEANGSLFKVAKGIGSTNWHAHDDQDEVFLVLRGKLVVELRDGDVELGEGELLVVPRGVEHRPRADREVHLLLVGTAVTSTAAGGKPEWSAGGGTPGPEPG
ncbi:MAG TPA: cupin domain-containing protein [Gaiellaceae bacterium]|nr:cupin domain-containing protein [Gaiellaceae bacterium]